MSDVAENLMTQSTIDAARTAAEHYPDLKIVCPWCSTSIFGRDFVRHTDRHREQHDVPPHWMAL